MKRGFSSLLVCCLLMLGLSGCLFSNAGMNEIDVSTTNNCITLGDALAFKAAPADYKIDPSTKVVLAAATPLVWVYDYIKFATWYSARALYESYGKNDGFNNSMVALGSLSIAFWGVAVLFGIVPARTYETSMYILRFVIAFGFAFNWEPFNEVFFKPLEGELQIDEQTGAYTVVAPGVVEEMVKTALGLSPEISEDIEDPIRHMLGDTDNLLVMMITDRFWRVVFALLASGTQGWLYGALFAFMMFSYFWAIMHAIQALLVAMIGRCLLYAIAPIMFASLLFTHTKSIFMGWAEQLMSYSLQPIFLAMWLGIINYHIIDFINEIPTDPGRMICYSDDYISIPVVSVLPKLGWWIFSDGTSEAEPMGPYPPLPINLWYLCGAFLLSIVLHQMTEWSLHIATRISGGIASVNHIHGLGYETAETAAKAKMVEVAAYAKGAVVGGKDKDGVKRRGGIVGMAAEVAEKGEFRPFHHIFGGASAAADSARSEGIRDTARAFNDEFGISKGHQDYDIYSKKHLGK